MLYSLAVIFFFFFNDTATTEIYTLSLHDALPIFHLRGLVLAAGPLAGTNPISSFRAILSCQSIDGTGKDRKSTRLNSSHQIISYAVFCLKKKKTRLT